MKNQKKQTQTLSMLLIFAAIITMLFSACIRECHECRDITIQEVSITEKIMGIIIEGPWEVIITHDSIDNSAELEYCVCIKDKVSAKLLSNGYLHIKVSAWNWGHYHCKTLNATIKATSLEKIEASGAATIRTYGDFGSLDKITLSGASTVNGLSCDGGSAKINLSGASTLKGFSFTGNSIDADLSGASGVTCDNVSIEYFMVDCSGASTFKSSGGYAAESSIRGSGASDIKVLNMETENLDIDLSGASTADATVNNTIKGRLAGASTLRYKRAKDVSGVHLSGASKIIRLD